MTIVQRERHELLMTTLERPILPLLTQSGGESCHRRVRFGTQFAQLMLQQRAFLELWPRLLCVPYFFGAARPRPGNPVTMTVRMRTAPACFRRPFQTTSN